MEKKTQFKLLKEGQGTGHVTAAMGKNRLVRRQDGEPRVEPFPVSGGIGVKRISRFKVA